MKSNYRTRDIFTLFRQQTAFTTPLEPIKLILDLPEDDAAADHILRMKDGRTLAQWKAEGFCA